MSDHHNPNHAFPQPSSPTGFGAQPARNLMPPPELTSPGVSSPIERRTSSSHHQRQKKLNRRNKTKPSPGDYVLRMSIADIARDAGAYAHNSDSDSDSDSDFEETDDDESLFSSPVPMPVLHQLLSQKRTGEGDQVERTIGQGRQGLNQNEAEFLEPASQKRDMEDFELQERKWRERENESDQQFNDRGSDVRTLAPIRRLKRISYRREVQRYENLFQCDVQDCYRAANGKGFATKDDLKRHRERFHSVEEQSYQCASEHCRNRGRIWPRLDSFKKHVQGMHKDETAHDLIERSVYSQNRPAYPQDNHGPSLEMNDSQDPYLNTETIRSVYKGLPYYHLVAKTPHSKSATLVNHTDSESISAHNSKSTFQNWEHDMKQRAQTTKSVVQAKSQKKSVEPGRLIPVMLVDQTAESLETEKTPSAEDHWSIHAAHDVYLFKKFANRVRHPDVGVESQVLPEQNVSLDDRTTSPEITREIDNSEEFRLRFDASQPISSAVRGDMSGRRLQIIPGEDGMAEVVIESHDNKPTCESDQVTSHIDCTDSDTNSEVSSYAASIISVQSLASSATDISRGSGYSAHQIATATKELVTIFQEDPILIPLYKHAIYDDSIGPAKLQRNLRRLFKQYAEHLKGEATDQLEYLAARLVSYKAGYLAHSIVQKYDDRRESQPEDSEANYESSEDEDAQPSIVDDTVFNDLIIFREFLVGSAAFHTFKSQMTSFVVPKIPQAPVKREVRTAFEILDLSSGSSPHQDSSIAKNITPSQKISAMTVSAIVRRKFEVLVQPFFALLVAIGCFESKLNPAQVRLRWECGCGDRFIGDFTEYKAGGIEDMITRMRQSTRAKIISRTSGSEGTNAKSKSTNQHPGLWIRNALTSLTKSFGKKSRQCALPQHTPSAAVASSTPYPNPPQARMLHLLSCMHAGRFRKSLAQDRIENFNTDRQLFCFIRQQYRIHRGRFKALLSLKTVKGIYFTKFRLPMGGSVEIRAHDPCCIQPQSCECIPPPSRVEPSPSAEYRCIPGPPSVWPPIDPHYLSHLFNEPSCINENDTWILDQLPKRTCGELHGSAGKPADGWGIYFEEGWDRDIITLVVVTLFLLSSLVFGVLWSHFKMDIQGAFGVSAYMMTACAAIISFVATKVDKA